MKTTRNVTVKISLILLAKTNGRRHQLLANNSIIRVNVKSTSSLYNLWRLCNNFISKMLNLSDA